MKFDFDEFHTCKIYQIHWYSNSEFKNQQKQPPSRFDEILTATYNTVWKLNNFPTTHILREIDFG